MSEARYLPTLEDLYKALRPGLKRELPAFAWPEEIEDVQRVVNLLENAHTRLKGRKRHDLIERGVSEWLNLWSVTLLRESARESGDKAEIERLSGVHFAASAVALSTVETLRSK